MLIEVKVPQLSESVSVSAASEQVQTTSGGIGRVISETQVSQLALNGREYTQLLDGRMLEGVAHPPAKPASIASSSPAAPFSSSDAAGLLA